MKNDSKYIFKIGINRLIIISLHFYFISQLVVHYVRQCNFWTSFYFCVILHLSCFLLFYVGFSFFQVHYILNEIITGGLVGETTIPNILKAYEEQKKLEKNEVRLT